MNLSLPSKTDKKYSFKVSPFSIILRITNFTDDIFYDILNNDMSHSSETFCLTRTRQIDTKRLNKDVLIQKKYYVHMDRQKLQK